MYVWMHVSQLYECLPQSAVDKVVQLLDRLDHRFISLINFSLIHKLAHKVAWRLQKVFSYIGVPRILHSDNGYAFVNNTVYSVAKE